MKEQVKKIRKAAAEKNLLKSTPISHGVGRRKTSIARVWLRHGDGEIIINGKNFSTYFHTDLSKRLVLEPIATTSTGSLFKIEINLSGGGVHSQAGAVRLGISRALASYNEEYKKTLSDSGFLTVDARRKERKKYGQKGARRKFQFVKR